MPTFNWPSRRHEPPQDRTAQPGWQPDLDWGAPPEIWPLSVDTADSPPPPSPRKRRTGRNILISFGVVLGLFFGFGALGAAAGGGADATAAQATRGSGTTVVPTPTPTEEAPVDADRDGVTDDADAYPTDASRHSTDDRDGDGAANASDVAPDDAAIAAWPTGLVTHVVDGDTIDVEGFGRIRIVGIDTPERDECGYEAATDLMTYLVLGKQVTLVPGAVDDRDAYDRLLRYVDVAGKDAGREMIGSGWAIARYDSRDGYGTHPREADYVSLDAQVPDKTCPPPAPAPFVPPAPAEPAGEPWNMPGPDLDCGDIRKKIRITGPDYHRLDSDRDGWACESYA